jgi:putative membrane protein
MERRLLRAIINPAMIATWLLGLWLVWASEAWRAGWFEAKFILVLILTAAHGFLARWRKDFAADRNRHSAKFYRVVNELPTLLMIGIVILAIVKPF